MTANLILSDIIGELDYLFIVQKIYLSTLRADGPVPPIKIQAMPIFTHPAALPGGIAHHQGISRSRVGDDSPGSYKSILSDLISTNNSSIGADRGPFSHQGTPELVLPGNSTAGIDHIGKYHRRAEEHIILTDDPRIQRDIILYFDLVAQDHSFPHHYILPDRTVLPDDAPCHYMRKMPDLCTHANGGALVDHGSIMDKIAHKGANINYFEEENHYFYAIFAL